MRRRARDPRRAGPGRWSVASAAVDRHTAGAAVERRRRPGDPAGVEPGAPSSSRQLRIGSHGGMRSDSSISSLPPPISTVYCNEPADVALDQHKIFGRIVRRRASSRRSPSQI